MANPANYFKPGESGNPNGRPPKEWTMAGLIREAAEEADETGVPKKQIIAKKLADLAVSGDMVAMKEFNNRIDGMPKQSTEISGPGGSSLKVIIERYGRPDNQGNSPGETGTGV